MLKFPLNTSIDNFTIEKTQGVLKVADRIELNIALLAFYRSINHGISKYNLVGGMMDEYQDQTGVDVASCLNQSYNGTSHLYTPAANTPDAYTVLLLHGDGSNGSTTFTDSETNSSTGTKLHAVTSNTKLYLSFDGADGATTFWDTAAENTVTAVGTAQIDTAQYKYGGSSLLLDGNSDYLTLADSADWYFNADFTVDCWIYVNSLAVTECIFSNGTDSNNDLKLFLLSNGTIVFYIQAASVNIVVVQSSTGVITTGSWMHVALVRYGNIYTIYKNGSSVATLTSASGPVDYTGTFNIGYYAASGTYFNGWLDEFRITKGEALWTSNFSLYVSPKQVSNMTYDAWDSYTMLYLRCDGADASTTFIDETGRHTMTAVGTAQVDTAQSMFGGASCLLDGNSDYLSAPDSDDWNFGSGDWTMDFWVRFNGDPTGTAMNFFEQWVNGNNYISLWKTASDRIRLSAKSSSVVVGDFYTCVLGWAGSQWYHIVYARNGSSAYIFRDGVSLAVETWYALATFPDLAASFYMGNGNYGYLNGWMDEIRITKGKALWTQDFPVLVSGYGAQLMLHCDGIDGATTLADCATGKIATFAGTAQLDTAQYKFGSASLLLDGNSDYISFADSNDFYFGTGNFTIDFWVRWAADPTGGAQTIISQWVDGQNFWNIYWYSGYVGMRFWLSNVEKGGYKTDYTTQSWTPNVGQWYHIACERVGTGAKIFIDGVSYPLITDTSFGANDVGNLAANLEIGRRGDNSSYFNGWIDEVRITKGEALWTTDFTPLNNPYGSVHVTTAVKKFGTGSLEFDGVGSYLAVPDSSDWYLGTADFTVDFWIRFYSLSASSGEQGILSRKTDNNNLWKFSLIDGGSPYWRLYIVDGGSNPVLTFNTTLSVNTWYHTALVRSGNNFMVFKDGVQQGATVVETARIPPLDGNLFVGALYLQGYSVPRAMMDELRISKGIARWTTTFTPWAYPYGSEPANMTLQSVATVPVTTPDEARIIVFEEDIDPVVLNTDLIAYVSRDNGVNWSQVTLVDEGDYSGTKRILSGIVDMKSLAPVLSSYNMKYKLMTSLKYMNIRGVSLNW
jgi:hypothetical protein